MKKVFFAVLVALAATSLNAKTPKTKATKLPVSRTKIAVERAGTTPR